MPKQIEIEGGKFESSKNFFMKANIDQRFAGFKMFVA
jgi:hypothetical protein